MPDDPEEFWKREEPKCLSRVKDLADYNERVQRGFDAALDHLHDSPDLLTPETLREVHAHIFGEVYDFAGKWRDGKREVQFGPERMFSGAYHTKIEDNLEHLRYNETAELISRAEFKEDVGPAVEDFAQAITFHHAKLHFIHPFRDGNSRTNLAITHALAAKFLPDVRIPELSEKSVDDYRAHRTYAQTDDVIRHLSKTLLGIDIPRESPYPIDVLPYPLVRRQKNGLYVSVVCGQSDDVRIWMKELKIPSVEKLLLEKEPDETLLRDGREIHISKTEQDAFSKLEGQKSNEAPKNKSPSPSRDLGSFSKTELHRPRATELDRARDTELDMER